MPKKLRCFKVWTLKAWSKAEGDGGVWEKGQRLAQGTSLFRSADLSPHLKHGRSLRAPPLLSLHICGAPQPATHLLDHDAVHAHGLESPRVVEHVGPAQGHGQHEAGEVLFVGKQVQEDRQYHKHSLDKTVQET